MRGAERCLAARDDLAEEVASCRAFSSGLEARRERARAARGEAQEAAHDLAKQVEAAASEVFAGARAALREQFLDAAENIPEGDWPGFRAAWDALVPKLRRAFGEPAPPPSALALAPGGYVYGNRHVPLSGHPLAVLTALLRARHGCVTADHVE